MLRRNSCRNGSKGFVKYITVDVPLSCKTFNKYFGMYLTPAHNYARSGCKLLMTVNQMSNIFGSNWHIFAQKNTTTHQRIIGDVTIHHRQKYSTLFDSTDCPR